MFGSITRAALAHKQVVIAAVAIAVLAMYAFPNTMVAFAQLPRIIDREIRIPCLPYCNVANEPEDVNVDIDDILHLHISFSFVPVR
jgi:hypothetical protein